MWASCQLMQRRLSHEAKVEATILDLWMHCRLPSMPCMQSLNCDSSPVLDTIQHTTAPKQQPPAIVTVRPASVWVDPQPGTITPDTKNHWLGNNSRPNCNQASNPSLMRSISKLSAFIRKLWAFTRKLWEFISELIGRLHLIHDDMAAKMHTPLITCTRQHSRCTVTMWVLHINSAYQICTVQHPSCHITQSLPRTFSKCTTLKPTFRQINSDFRLWK